MKIQPDLANFAMEMDAPLCLKARRNDWERMMDAPTQDHLIYEASRKSTGVAYLLWFLLGFLGAHRFYLGRTGTAITQLILSCTIIGLIPMIFWWIYDGVRTAGMVEEENVEIIREMQAQGRFLNPAPASHATQFLGVDDDDTKGLSRPSLDPRVEEIRAMRRR